MARPILDDIELQNVQRIELDREQVLEHHQIPALEGDFFQGLDRRASSITLSGVLTGADVGEKLDALRDRFRDAEPVAFVSDIVTATRVDQVLIEEMTVREAAGLPERFEYAFTLREFLTNPSQDVEPIPPDEPTEPETETGTLEVTVIVESEPDFDPNRITVTRARQLDDGSTDQQTMTARQENVWTEIGLDEGSYTVEALTDESPARSGSAQASVQAGQTAQVTITLASTNLIATAFIVHYHFDSAFVEPCMRHVLNQVMDHAAANPSQHIVILGHTDLAGSDAYNQALSERRARGVYAFLTFGREAAAAKAEWDQLRRARATLLHDVWGAREYQYMLQDLGYYPGNINGRHDALTNSAVEAFQRDQELTVDGQVGDNTWGALIDAYLGQDGFGLEAARLIPNRNAAGCDGGEVKWLGAGEKDFIVNTADAERRNRRTEILFVNSDHFPCEVPQPVTFDLPAPGAMGSSWCLGPGDPNNRHCFLARSAPAGTRWLVRNFETGSVQVTGSIHFEDGTPFANGNYVLIAPDGQFMDGEVPRTNASAGLRAGSGTPGRTDANGAYSPRVNPKSSGIYTIIVEGPVVARREGSAGPARGNTVCARLGDPPLNIILNQVLPQPANPGITASGTLVVVKKPYTAPARVLVTLTGPTGYSGSGTLTRSEDRIRFFDAAVNGNEITFNGTDNVFTGAQLSAGHPIFGEGARASTGLDDVVLTLNLHGGNAVPGRPATVALTAVEIVLEIGASRSAAGVDPAPLTEAEKASRGRFVQIQDAGNHAGRALITVRQAIPAAFAGNLVLQPISPAVRLFGAADELAATGQAAVVTPRVFANGAIPATGERFWVEGIAVSGALRDTGFMLGIDGTENDGDRAVMTVIRLRELVVDTPSTPQNTARAAMPNLAVLAQPANNPVPRHALTHAPGGLNPNSFETDFALNPPLVWLENSVPANNPITLSVQVDPAGVPVSWSVLRDTRPAPDGDHADIPALSPNPVPTLAANPANGLSATLLTDAVGSFHIRPFVDGNGNGRYDSGIDREPALVLNNVMIRTLTFQDSSLAQPANVSLTPAVRTAATGLSVRAGNFNGPATAGVHSNATVTVIGGGPDGRRGLDRLFAGWVNNITNNTGESRFQDGATTHRHTLITASNNPSLTLGRTGAFLPAGVPAPAGSTNAPPAILTSPFLDATPFGNEGTGGNTCVGTEGAIGPPVAIVKTPLPRVANPVTVGEDWQIEMFDSPGFGASPTHAAFPGTLTGFNMNFQFRADLCFWTNIDGNAAPTASPGGTACRLYASAHSNTWAVVFRNTFDAAGVETILTPATVVLTNGPLRATIPVANSGLEVRLPIFLRLAAIDART